MSRLTAHPAAAASAVALAAGAVIGIVSAVGRPSTSGAVWLAILGAALVVLGIVGVSVCRHGWPRTLMSPIGVVALLVACLFVLRALGVVYEPGSVLPGLAQIGFTWADLSRAVGIGSAGFAIFGAAFLAAWGPGAAWADAEPGEPVADRRLIRGVAAALVIGSALWLPVMFRNGGIHALLHDPSAIHLGQYGAGYGSLGYGLCLATFLVVLWLWLWHRTRASLWLLAVSAGVCLLAAICLQTRGPLIATGAAAVVLVIARRTLSRRQAIAGIVVTVCLVFGLFYMRTVRDATQTQSLGVALTSAAKKNPLTLPGLDFAELDGLVIIERLVPHALPYLHGSSLGSVPGVFIPRRLWPGKPFPVDRRLARAIYGREAKAGTPFTLAGEMLWNFGIAGSLIAMALAGGLAGLGWRVLSRHGSTGASLLRALIVGYAYLLLTRPLGPMVLTFGFGAAGLVAAIWLLQVSSPRDTVNSLRSRLRPPKVASG